METVNNITNAASRAIWGDGGSKDQSAATEPLSGETGDVKAGEPYDKGNLGDNAGATNTTDSEPSATKLHKSEPTIAAEPASNTAPQTQGADAPQKDVDPGSDEHQRILATKKEAEEAAKVEISGPGPRPLADVAKGNPATGSGKGEDGPQTESHGEGTGEKYVQSTGLAADGGDFDAANPGAGKEADRLLAEKGIAPAGKPDVDSKESSKEDVTGKDVKEKRSLKDKIKAKLHKH